MQEALASTGTNMSRDVPTYCKISCISSLLHIDCGTSHLVTCQHMAKAIAPNHSSADDHLANAVTQELNILVWIA